MTFMDYNMGALILTSAHMAIGCCNASNPRQEVQALPY